jgi:hypothetical protein
LTIGVVDVVQALLFVSDVGIWIALMTDWTRDSIMKINPTSRTLRKDVGNFFPLRNEKQMSRQFSSSGFNSPVFDMLLLFTTLSIPMLDGWSYKWAGKIPPGTPSVHK